MLLAGVMKRGEDVFANKFKEDDDQEYINQAREKVKEVANDIIKWYKKESSN